MKQKAATELLCVNFFYCLKLTGKNLSLRENDLCSESSQFEGLRNSGGKLISMIIKLPQVLVYYPSYINVNNNGHNWQSTCAFHVTR